MMTFPRTAVSLAYKFMFINFFQDLNCKKSLGIHWGTFTMGAIEHYMAPRKDMEKERAAAGVPEDDFFVLDHGGSRLITAENMDV